MKRQILLLLFILVALIGKSQQTILFNTGTGQISKSKNFSRNSDSVYNRIVITLPDTGFERVWIRVNNLDFGFTNKTKPRPKNFIPLYAQDIANGQVVLKFKGKQLLAIGDRVSPNLDPVLKGKDTVSLWFTLDSIKRKADMDDVLSFYKEEETEQHAAKPAEKAYYTSKYCQIALTDTTLSPLPNLSFRCKPVSKKDECFCTPAVSDPYNKIYQPPCYDVKGNAVSATNHILIDTREKMESLYKYSLYKLESKKHDCAEKGKGRYEVNIKYKKMNLQEGTLVPISVIAHKDSIIVFDSNYVNYFLEDAKVVDSVYSEAGKKVIQSTDSTKKLGVQSMGSLKLLHGTVSLRDDLMAFNKEFEKASFLKTYYIEQLICLQQKVAEFYSLTFIPATGHELATAIDNSITPEDARKYARFLCTILGIVAQQYDMALKHQANYRIYTKYFQVPNADEITFKARTKNGTELFNQKFLIKGGWKIDFSTGVFVTGLNSSEYIQVSGRFAYRDSLTGPLKDTTANLLSANKGKLNFSTGFLVHLYKRSGNYFNWGAVTGITINDDDFKMLFGGSAMFRMGNGRLSFIAGGAVGKQKQLDANQQQYNIKSAELTSNKIYIQNDINNRLPRFFAETNIQTYDKLKLSWFAGITYNFAGLNLGK